MDKFEQLLKDKLWQEVSSEFDQQLYLKFEDEFGREEQSLFDLTRGFVAASFILFIMFSSLDLMQEDVKNYQVGLIKMTTMLEDYELLADIDEEILELTDNDWNELLGAET